MKKQLIIIVLVFAVLFVSTFASAAKTTLTLLDPDGKWLLEKQVFVHYKTDDVKPQNPGKTGSAICYKLMGVAWDTLPVDYVINPTNSQGLQDSFVTSAVQSSAETWDSATSKELFADSYLVDNTAQYGAADGKNAIAFGAYSQNNVIAVTTVWYTRVGKKIVEFDILFNDAYQWGDATSNSSVMDLQNIATHELGHSVGLSDVYTQSCSAVTMYGYSAYGETSKRTLEPSDILGLQKIYGR